MHLLLFLLSFSISASTLEEQLMCLVEENKFQPQCLKEKQEVKKQKEGSLPVWLQFNTLRNTRVIQVGLREKNHFGHLLLSAGQVVGHSYPAHSSNNLSYQAIYKDRAVNFSQWFLELSQDLLISKRYFGFIIKFQTGLGLEKQKYEFEENLTDFSIGGESFFGEFVQSAQAYMRVALSLEPVYFSERFFIQIGLKKALKTYQQESSAYQQYAQDFLERISQESEDKMHFFMGLGLRFGF